MRPGLPFIRKRLAESGAGLARLALDPSLAPEILRVAACLRRALARGNKVLIFGNGGSAAQAQHLAAELVNRLHRERKALAALALTTDSSCLTSIANDWDFHRVFSRQLEALGRHEDLASATELVSRLEVEAGRLVKYLQESGITS
jgi:D-sedoheptulose 7-phosphate isomerase